MIFWKPLPVYNNQYWGWSCVGNTDSSPLLNFVLDLDLRTDTVYYGIEVGVAVQSSGGVGVGARKDRTLLFSSRSNT